MGTHGLLSIVQTVLYIDFFYYYSMAKWYGNKLVLPIADPLLFDPFREYCPDWSTWTVRLYGLRAVRL